MSLAVVNLYTQEGTRERQLALCCFFVISWKRLKSRSVNKNLILLQSLSRLTSRDLALTKTFENAQPLKVPKLFHPNTYLTFTS